MRRLIALLLLFVLCISLVGCGKTACSIDGCENEAVEDTSFEESYCSKHLADKKAFEVSKIAYENIETAYDIIYQFKTDLYQVWYMTGNSSAVKIHENGFAQIVSIPLYISDEDLWEGFRSRIKSIKDSGNNSITNEDIENPDLLLKRISQRDLYSICPFAVVDAYTVNGEIGKAEEALENAKTQMKILSEAYSDYEHYPNLKNYYTTVQALLE